MRILQSAQAKTPGPGAPETAAAPDLGRLDALERIAKSILQKLQILEEKVESLESPAPPAQRTQASEPTVPARASSYPKITMDESALKKGLLSTMWKYLNDGR